MLKKLLILIFVMYVKNKFQPVIVIAIFWRNNRETEHKQRSRWFYETSSRETLPFDCSIGGLYDFRINMVGKNEINENMNEKLN